MPGNGGRWSLYRDTYVNGINQHGTTQRVEVQTRINNGPLRPWSMDVSPGATWELSIAQLLGPGETTGIFKATASVTCSAPGVDGLWSPVQCDAQVALWHDAIAIGTVPTVYNVPFSCAQ